MKIKHLFYFLLLFVAVEIKAQNIGINNSGATPNAAALLDIDATGFSPKLGLLIPRVTATERAAITLTAPAQGLVVYQTDGTQGFYYNTSTSTTPAWSYLSPYGENWTIVGNTLTGASSSTPNEWEGSSNAYDWIVKTANTERMRIKSTGNVGIGTTAPSQLLHVAGGSILTDKAYAATTYTVVASTSAFNTGPNPATQVIIQNNGSTNGSLTYGAVPIEGQFLWITNNDAQSVVFSSAATTIPTNKVMGFVYTNATWREITANNVGATAWSLSGNAGTTPGTQFIGTTDAVDWVVKTTGTERMRVLSTGNVGIGTTTPNLQLGVNGEIGVDQADLANGSALRGIHFGFSSGEGIGSNRTTPANLNQWGLDFYTSYLRRMSISNTGEVGIGTAAPAYPLTIGVVGTGATFGVENTATFTAKNSTGTYENYLWPRWSDNIMYLNYGTGGFNIRNNGSTSTIFLTNTNLVGIGTTAPAQKLHVVGTERVSTLASGASGAIVTSNGSGDMGVTNFTGSATQVLLGNNTFGNVPTNTVWSLTGNGATVAGTNFIGTTDAVDWVVKTSNVERMRVLSTGSVGIGTATPTAKLEIGDINIVTSSTQPGNLNINTTTAYGADIGSSISLSGAVDVGPINRTFATIEGRKTNAAAGSRLGYLAFKTNSTAAGNLTEKMRITATGNIGIGTTAPDASALLDVTSTSTGILIPRVALTASNLAGPIAAPLTSLLVYNTATAGINPNNVSPGYYYWNGSKWVSLTGGVSGNDWTINGNAGTTETTNFMGTIDSVALVFKVNNHLAGRIGLSGGANDHNTSFGDLALADPTSGDNTAFGTFAAQHTDVGQDNTAVGSEALRTASGYDGNTAIGSKAMQNGGNSFSTAVGRYALRNGGGGEQVAIGNSALSNNTTGYYNSAVGSFALFSNTTGFYNTSLGYQAGYTSTPANATTTGSNNTFLGYNTGFGSATQRTNATAIGSNAKVDASNAMVLGGTGADAVNVGIGTTTPDTKAKLDITSTNSGLLIPRVALTTANNSGAPPIATPTTSLLVYNTATVGTGTGINDLQPGYYYWNGVKWISISGGTSGNTWSTTGNSGTSSATNFIGTTDANSLQFKVNNQKGGFIDQSANAVTALGYQALNVNAAAKNTAVGYQALVANAGGANNTAMGYQSLNTNVSGNNNTAYGYQSLFSNSGSDNTALGYNTLLQNTGAGNTGIGKGALESNQAGSYNVAVGFFALNGNTPSTTQVNNVALGSYAGFNNQNGTDNMFVGYKSGYTNRGGDNNIFIGKYAGRENDTAGTANSTEASNNIFMGNNSGYSNKTGYTNVFLGNSSGYYNNTGHDNVFLGQSSGLNNTGGYQNVFIGLGSGSLNTSGYSNTFLGYLCAPFEVDGHDNVALGQQAAAALTSGNYNTSIGIFSGQNLLSGANNTSIGSYSGAQGDFSYTAAFGFNAKAWKDSVQRFGDNNTTKWGFGANAQVGQALKVGTTGLPDGNGNGAYLTSGGVWTSISDRNLKTDFTILDGNEILFKINQLDITRWRYKNNREVMEYHIGPMAQDFYRLFNVGLDSVSISTIDPSGVALLGVKELSKQNEELKKQVHELQAQVKAIKELLNNKDFIKPATSEKVVTDKK